MLHLSDQQLHSLLDAPAVQAVLEDAFSQFGREQAAQQRRMRTEAAGIRLSTLGAVIPGQQVAGAKIYTTVQGVFNFVIVLFDTVSGAALATFDAGAITQWRTAACSVLAARRGANPLSQTLGVLGLGAQGLAHARQFCRAFDVRRVLVWSPTLDRARCHQLEWECGVPVQAARPDEIAAQADILVTASRSREPLFDGRLLKPGCFVAAVGSSLPTARELDDACLRRARKIVVEWAPQTLAEAGDLRLAASDCGIQEKLCEMSDWLKLAPGQGYDLQGICVYKSVGVAIEDIAVAGLAYRCYQRMQLEQTQETEQQQ
ncbi:ornithine cyclodeaminase family protein [Alcaligenes sp. SDU_A2]|uniref:ornithine cyclodeaminase family protein n=1 Tax=Alcaligenes sp. SDU_A2 TaxID=3136634 RepID=UPI00311E21CB